MEYRVVKEKGGGGAQLNFADKMGVVMGHYGSFLLFSILFQTRGFLTVSHNSWSVSALHTGRDQRSSLEKLINPGRLMAIIYRWTDLKSRSMGYNYEGNIHKIAYFQIYCATDSCTWPRTWRQKSKRSIRRRTSKFRRWTGLILSIRTL